MVRCLQKIVFKILLTLFVIISCSQKKLKEYQYESIIFGSYVKIIIPAQDSLAASNFIRETFKIFRHIDSVASMFNQSSEIAMINRYGRGKMSLDLKNLVAKSIEVAEKTDGAFDITVGSVLKNWGLYEDLKSPQTLPINDSCIVNYKSILIKSDSIFLMPHMNLDLGGIAVGYALDKAAEFLQRNGVPYGLIDAGGDIICWGNKSFRIGIKNPSGAGVIKILNIKNKAVSTSGGYERYRTRDSIKYTHIVDPHTKTPIIQETNSLVSVTIIANKCVDADAYATAIFVLGKDKGLTIMKELNLKGILITRDGQLIEIN
ncbi:MAG: FAD:protein FMN transferase [candidate division WOR-3 bacterium]